MAILKGSAEQDVRAGARRLTWLALLPVIVALGLVGFIGWVGFSTGPVTVGRYQFIGPRCTGPAMYVWTRGSVSSVWVSTYNPVTPTPVLASGSAVIFARGALTAPPGMRSWVWMNRGGAGHFAVMRLVWELHGFALLEEAR